MKSLIDLLDLGDPRVIGTAAEREARSRAAERTLNEYTPYELYLKILRQTGEPLWIRLVRRALKQPTLAEYQARFAALGGNWAGCERLRHCL